MPGYDVFYQMLTRMDPEALATLRTGWLQTHHGHLPTALALDGKMIRDHIGLLTLAQHEDGAPHAVAVFDQKENTPRSEQTAAAALLEKLPALDGKLITAEAAEGNRGGRRTGEPDPLHCQRSHARVIVEKGGDYLLQIKGNQPKLHAQARTLDALAGPPFLPTAKADTGGSTPGASPPSSWKP